MLCKDRKPFEKYAENSRHYNKNFRCQNGLGMEQHFEVMSWQFSYGENLHKHIVYSIT